jgi:hypothetical protein
VHFCNLNSPKEPLDLFFRRTPGLGHKTRKLHPRIEKGEGAEGLQAVISFHRSSVCPNRDASFAW